MARIKRLLSIEALDEGNELLNVGVPMSKVHLQLGLEGIWSYQSTTDIFKADRGGLTDATRPAWLRAIDNPEESVILSPPDNWRYEGMFPWGEWVQTPHG